MSSLVGILGEGKVFLIPKKKAYEEMVPFFLEKGLNILLLHMILGTPI